MRDGRIGLLLASALVLLYGCAATQKPKELEALENLRSDSTLSDPDRKAFDLLAAADALLVQASRAWEHREVREARSDALMGQIKMKTALALLQAERSRERIAALDAELSISTDEQGRLESQLATAREEVDLLARLRTMKAATAAEKKALADQVDITKKEAATERQKLTEQLATEKQKEKAQNGIRVVELTLKIAETVDAPHYAKAAYTAAQGMLQEAHKDFDAGQWDQSIERLTLAQSEAEKGIALARPQYEKATEALSRHARDRELEADATEIPDARPRLEHQGDLQRLVLVLPSCFAEGRSTLLPSCAKTIDAVKDLLSKYPTYPLQLTGYTDDQGKRDDLTLLSLARANAVYWALVGRGMDPKRMSVEGKGPANPIADNASPSGRGQNARVELAILYHDGSDGK